MRKCNPSERQCPTGGTQFCVLDGNDQESWTACCTPDETNCYYCAAPWDNGGSGGCVTPLVLAFANEPVRFLATPGEPFDLTRERVSVATDWPTAATPWLALDRDGSGRIEGGGELFGSATVLASGAFADNGFAALAELDANRDGVIDRADPAFAQLLLWRDADGDRASAPGELAPAAAELDAIRLGFVSSPRCDARGNCEVERATFVFRDAAGEPREGAVIDVHLREQD